MFYRNSKKKMSHKGFFVPSNQIDGLPWSGGKAERKIFQTVQEFEKFVQDNFIQPHHKTIHYNTVVDCKIQRDKCTHYVYEGDAPFFNDLAQHMFLKANVQSWVNDDVGIFGNVLFYSEN